MFILCDIIGMLRKYISTSIKMMVIRIGIAQSSYWGRSEVIYYLLWFQMFMTCKLRWQVVTEMLHLSSL